MFDYHFRGCISIRNNIQLTRLFINYSLITFNTLTSPIYDVHACILTVYFSYAVYHWRLSRAARCTPSLGVRDHLLQVCYGGVHGRDAGGGAASTLRPREPDVRRSGAAALRGQHRAPRDS